MSKNTITLLILFVLFQSASLAAQQMLPLRDLEPNMMPSGGGIVFPMGAHNGELLFRQSGHNHGQEIWATDGTASGTYLRIDANLGQASSQPQNVFDYNGLLLYTADDGDTGTELWRSDGTPSGTYLLKDINPGSLDSYPSSYVIYGSTVFFSAFDNTNGRELWKTDGTVAGTVLVKDINPGSSSSDPSDFRVLGTNLIFVAENNTNGLELFTSNGTAAGTTVLKDLYPGVGDSWPSGLTVFNNEVFFAATDGTNIGEELYKTDGTASGTVLVKNINGASGSSSRPTGMIVKGSELFFFVTSGGNSWTIWKSDGTTAGTIQAIGSIVFNHEPEEVVLSNGVLFFNSVNGSNGEEVWRTDGTAGGTFELADVWPGGSSSQPEKFRVAGGQVFFVGKESSSNRQLWVSDGSVAGTQRVKTAGLPGLAQYPMAFNGKLYMNVNNELWVSDGTDAGTQEILELRTKGYSTSPRYMTKLASEILFYKSSKLFKTDGTWAGTELVVRTFTLDLSPEENIALGSYIIFTANDQVNGTEVWKSDGTDSGTTLLKDINTSAGAGSTPGEYASWGAQVVFSANDGTSWGVYSSDGTTAGTVLVKGGFTNSPDTYVEVGSNFFFLCDDGTNGEEVWFSDGTTAGTILPKDINTSGSSNPLFPVSFNGKLFFSADDGTNGRELWMSDGSSAGTTLVIDINTGGDGLTLSGDLGVLGSNLLFAADNGTSGKELWKSDGTAAGTSLLMDINSGSLRSYPAYFAIVGSRAIFSAETAASGREMWVTDGTAAGTMILADAWPGFSSSVQSVPESVGALAYYTAGNPVDGVELWQTDGTPGGTLQVGPAIPGAKGIKASSFILLGSNLIFDGDNGLSGHELWIRSADTAPYIIPSQGSQLSIPSTAGSELVVTVPAGTPLNGVTIELLDSTTSAVLSLNVVTASTNGITPPVSGTGLASGATSSFSGIPTSAGMTSFTLEVSDGVNSPQSFQIIFNITQNAAPTLNAPTGSGFSLTATNEFTIVVLQGNGLSTASLVVLDSTVGAAVDVTVSPAGASNGIVPPSGLTGTASGTVLTFTGAALASGSTAFTIDLDDGTSQVSFTIIFSVQFNDLPLFSIPTGSVFVLTSPGNYQTTAYTNTVMSDVTIRLDDPDTGTQLAFSVNPGTLNGITPPIGASGIPTSTVMQFTGTPLATGTYSWTLSISDGFNSPVTATFYVNVLSNNLPYAAPGTQSVFTGPVAGVFTANVNQGQLIGLADITIFDADSGAILDIIVTPPAQNSIVAPSSQTGLPNGYQLLWSGSPTLSGVYDFTLSIGDGIASPVVYIVRIIVAANVAPYLEAASGSLLSGPDAGNKFTIQWTSGVPLHDVSVRLRDATVGDTMTLGSLSGSQGGIGPPNGLNLVDGAVQFYQGTPSSVGVFTFSLSLSDGVSVASYTVEFDIVAGNSSPIITTTPSSIVSNILPSAFSVGVLSGTTLSSVELSIVDPNPLHTLSIVSISGVVPGVSNPALSTGLPNPTTMLWSGTPNVAGTYVLTIDVQDNLGAGHTSTLTFSITSPPVPPTIISIPPVVAYSASAYSYDVQTTGYPAPTISATGLPSWLSISGSTLSGIPAAGDIGNSYSITLTAANGSSPDATQFFILLVSSGPPPTTGSGDGSSDDSGCSQLSSRRPALLLIIVFLLARVVALRRRES